jgi:WS/DGAT/MGAT family acyltransferase
MGTANEQKLNWGASERISPLDTMMWRIEADPSLRSTMIGIELLDTTPDWDRFVAAHDWASRMVPRLRQRVVELPLGLGTPHWSVQADFDLRYHVRRYSLGAWGGWPELLDAAAQFAMTPFDPARPPWEAVLYTGLPGGKAAYLLKLHHATTDGLGVIALLSDLHSRSREHSAGKPQPAAPEPGEESPLRTLAEQIGYDAEQVGTAAQAAGGGVLRSLGGPATFAREALAYGASLRRVLAGKVAEGSPLLARRSMSWRFAAMDVAYQDLHAAAKAAGGSLNDGYIAALLGGFRRYHEKMGARPTEIPMAIPISVRSSSDEGGGNRIASGRIVGPMEIADPARRVGEVRKLVHAARDEPALDAANRMAPLLARLPGQVLAKVAGGTTKNNDLQASNIPGIAEEVYLAGAKVERLYPYAPLPGCAAMITLLTHGETCCIGANFDAAAITEPDLFTRALADGFAEVLDLAPGAGRPVVRG